MYTEVYARCLDDPEKFALAELERKGLIRILNLKVGSKKKEFQVRRQPEGRNPQAIIVGEAFNQVAEGEKPYFLVSITGEDEGDVRKCSDVRQGDYEDRKFRKVSSLCGKSDKRFVDIYTKAQKSLLKLNKRLEQETIGQKSENEL